MSNNPVATARDYVTTFIMAFNQEIQSQSAHHQDVPIRVVIIEDMREVREGLTMLINGTPGFRCAGSYRSMREALDRIGAQTADIILTDIGLPGMSGIEGARILRERLPSVPILALTIYDNDEKIFAALCAGASGYLLKNTPPAKLLESLTEALNGGAPMSPEVARRVVKLFREFHPPEQAEYRLTPQEMQLLYHCNLGPPFLEAGSRVVVPFRELAPLTARAASPSGLRASTRRPRRRAPRRPEANRTPSRRSS